MGKVVGFVNQKGGVGKTSLLYQMAYTLAFLKKRVLCLDLDPQANLTLLVRQRFNHLFPDRHDESSLHLYHLLVNSVKELKSLHCPVLVSDVLKESDGVYFLPSGSELSGLDLTFSQLQATPKQLVLKRFLDRSGLLEQYDWILLDAPPTLGLMMVNILCACDGLLIPFRPDLFSFHGFRLVEEVVEQIKDMELVKPPSLYGLLPNFIDERRKQEMMDLQQIREDLKEKVLVYPPLKQKVILSKLNAHGQHIFDSRHKDYGELQEHFLQWASLLEGACER
jgi:chromosome partitioning protein